MNFSLRSFMWISLLLFAFPLAAQSSRDVVSLKLDVVPKGNRYFVAITNQSQSTVRLPPIFMGDAERSGYWLFLYEVKSAQIDRAFSTTFNTIGPQKEWPRSELKSGSSFTETYAAEDLLKYFYTKPGNCYLLVIVYRKRWGNSLFYAPPSQPARVCAK